jgi:uncharacterized membrane protein YsdA (DUF1294 family)/cold shock CspA family protein
MRYQGRITGWKDEQGFGFVAPNGGGQQAFVHVKAFARGQKRPLGNELITYELAYDPMGRPQAENVAFVGKNGKVAAPPGLRQVFLLCFAALFMLAVGATASAGVLPGAVFGLYAALSAVTFCVYAFDKAAAGAGRWRTSESTLHLLAMAGGWPGAAAAQSLLSHKSSKAAFQLVYRATVVLNCGALGWLVFSLRTHGGF